jgi:NAD+ synthase
MGCELSEQAKTNLPARIRMTTLYAVAQTVDAGRVINTSNLSEDWVGFATLYGDATGAFSPLGMLTTDEVIAMGRELGLPEHLVIKVPADGLTNKTDEDNFGFTYTVLNKYIRTGICEDTTIRANIDRKHKLSRFKFLPMPMYNPGIDIKAKDIANIYS